jgi:hypothetical protein
MKIAIIIENEEQYNIAGKAGFFNELDYNKIKSGYSLDKTAISKMGFSTTEYYEKEITYQLLTFQEWQDSLKPKMEVGKFYKFFWNIGKREVVCKVSEIKSNCFIISWRKYIDNGHESSLAGFFTDSSNIQELSLQEVQQYLPEDHPDKIKSTVKSPSPLPFPDSKYTKLRVIKEYRRICGQSPTGLFLPVGYETWLYGIDESNIYVLEDNRWKINFPAHHFEVIEVVDPNEISEISSPTKFTEPINNITENLIEDMSAIQEECKRRFPIGCTFLDAEDKKRRVLEKDNCTYSIQKNMVWAQLGHGSLFFEGKYAELISLPETKFDMDNKPTMKNSTHEERVEFFNKYYPVGTQIQRMNIFGTLSIPEEIVKVEGTPYIHSNQIWDGKGYIFSANTWANIVQVAVTDILNAPLNPNECYSEKITVVSSNEVDNININASLSELKYFHIETNEPVINLKITKEPPLSLINLIGD